ncbi:MULTISPECIES: hypothetical protein [Paenibacillus]|uniref:hypothetical protein n=1 Tax=Paenibacillus TaxID=44249 RepID=UPI000B846D72|nr:MULTISPECIES: hypothetical protein [Paenibacillus]PRA03439.1 hypothetical protein CQ043_18060 [Paenibacillus sp. MYb63]PRA46857.1 hypothetical protein CQ061_16325 [Paenibacillus sp. MYb67]QZN76614.1 hypothetical protein K5K90_04935 [Paenibacillus sp. DR312]
MLFNIILGASVALSILLSAHPASAVDVEDRVQDALTTSPITMENTEDSIINPMDVQLIRPFNYSSYNAYEKSFTLVPDNGEDADVWIQNNSTDTIYAKITVGNLSPIDIPIKKGTQKTTRIGVIGTTNVKVYIYSSTDHKMDMIIRAQQF